MKVLMLRMSMAIFVGLLGCHLFAQELIPSPDPIGGSKVAADSDTHDLLANVPAAIRWRYRWYDGHWWYWTPQDRWMWYGSDGRWIEFTSPDNSPTVYRNSEYAAPRPGYYAPAPGAPIYTPGVAVGVRPYAGVNVGVSRRIGVDVWGPHGSVRVGRIFVGW